MNQVPTLRPASNSANTNVGQPTMKSDSTNMPAANPETIARRALMAHQDTLSAIHCFISKLVGVFVLGTWYMRKGD